MTEQRWRWDKIPSYRLDKSDVEHYLKVKFGNFKFYTHVHSFVQKVYDQCRVADDSVAAQIRPLQLLVAEGPEEGELSDSGVAAQGHLICIQAEREELLDLQTGSDGD